MPKQNTAPLIPDRPTLMLIDGHSMVYRAYFALAPQMTLTLRSTGEPTGAVFNFVNMFFKAWQDVQPDYWVIAFDAPGKVFRDDLYADYKAGRPETPGELAVQFRRVRQVVEALGMPMVEVPGYEADDVIGTISREAADQGIDTMVLTGDTDLAQLVSPHVRLRYQSFRGRSETAIYDVAKVRDRYGLEPSHLIDYKALVGDTSDNIPGIPGVGEKTAAFLLQKYGDIPNIYAHLDEVEVPRMKNIRELLTTYRDQVEMSRKLVTIDVAVPLELDFESARTEHYDRDRVIEVFRELEFLSLIQRLPGADEVTSSALPAQSEEANYKTVDSLDGLDTLVEELRRAGRFALDVQGTSHLAMAADLAGFAAATEPGRAWYVPLGHLVGAQVPFEQGLQRLKGLLEDPDVAKITHNGKYDTIVLANKGIALQGVEADVTIAAYLAGAKALTIKGQAFERLGVDVPAPGDMLGTASKAITAAQATIGEIGPYACLRADATFKLWPLYQAELAEKSLTGLLQDVEMPLLGVLARVERWGVAIDVDVLHAMSQEMGQQLVAIEKAAYDSVGHMFKINSPKELSQLLFEELGLKGSKRTKQGYSTDAQVLEGLRDHHPVIDHILDYRQISKIKSTYVDALPEMVLPSTGRVHTTLSQTVAATGRLSSSDPNLQNIPVRTDLGMRVRRAFIADPPTWTLLSADYSQIELRILAHITLDPNLLEAFHRDEDIHASTAARVFNVPLEEVTPDQRRFAKVVNFGLLYGMGEFGLATRADIAREEAAPIIAEYFEKFPSIRTYLDETKAAVREKGYVETLLGRRRYIPEIRAANAQVRAAGERMAINHPIQGTAADIIKLGMIHLQRRMDEAHLASRMVLQVHDELIFETPGDEIEAMRDLVVEVMPKAMDLETPLKVDLKQGRSWGEMT